MGTTRLGFKDLWKPNPRVIEDELWFSSSTIAVIYLFTLNSDELNKFVEENWNTSHELLHVFKTSKDFWKLEEWESAFFPQDITSHGIYKFIKHQYVRLLDIKSHKDEKEANAELEILHRTGIEHLKGNQLFLTFTDKKIEFTDADSIPDGKFYLLIDPSYVCLKSELKSNQSVFTCKAIVLKNIHSYLRLKTSQGNLIIYLRQKGSEYYNLQEDTKVEIAITKTELLNENGEPVKHKFVAVGA